MNIQQAVRQALAAGAIAQITIDQLERQDMKDTRALVILQEAIDNGIVKVLVSR